MPTKREVLENEVDAFNRRYPVGSRVRYWPSPTRCEDTRTRSAAEILAEHIAVVWLDGVPGCVALTHITVILPEKP